VRTLQVSSESLVGELPRVRGLRRVRDHHAGLPAMPRLRHRLHRAPLYVHHVRSLRVQCHRQGPWIRRLSVHGPDVAGVASRHLLYTSRDLELRASHFEEIARLVQPAYPELKVTCEARAELARWLSRRAYSLIDNERLRQRGTLTRALQ
jgi:hypothetical protein